MCSLLHSPVTSSLLGPNTVLSTLFPNTLSLCFSHNVKGQISQPYTITGKIILILVYLDSFFFLGRRISFPWKGSTLNIKPVKGFKTSTQIYHSGPGNIHQGLTLNKAIVKTSNFAFHNTLIFWGLGFSS